MPFASMGCMFKVMFSGKSRGKGKIMLKVLIGIGVAVIPTLMVFCLLSYDSDFMNLLGDIFDFNFKNIFSHILSLTFGAVSYSLCAVSKTSFFLLKAMPEESIQV